MCAGLLLQMFGMFFEGSRDGGKGRGTAVPRDELFELYILECVGVISQQ